MPTTFFPADASVRAMLDDLIAEFRRDLIDKGEVRIGLMMALGAKGTPALKMRGRPLLGKCKVHSTEQRANGMPDATITLCGANWPHLSPKRRVAVLHHELKHIDDYDGDRDELDRAILGSRKGDFEFDGFHELIEMYGEDSVEVMHLNAIAERHRQLGLPFGQATPEPETAGV